MIFFPLNAVANKYPLHTLPFKIAQCNFKYLGVCITNRYQDLFKFNFDNLLLQVQKDFERWWILPISLAGRINSVKMNTLPKFMYLFQCIPIFLPQSFFQRVDRLILEFIWDKKTARISKALLQRPKSLGGMGLPNFRHYYWAANFRVFQYWLNQAQSPMWLAMEVTSCIPTTLTALLYSPINSSFSPYTKNYIVKTSL